MLLAALVGAHYLYRAASEPDELPPTEFRVGPALPEKSSKTDALRSDRGAIEGRPADPANLRSPEARVGARTLEEYRELADSARNLDAELAEGASEWTQTLLAQDDMLAHYRDRDQCRHAFLPTGVCRYTLESVIERNDLGGGTVAYVRVTPDGEASFDCRAYASCIASTKVGQDVPLPDGVETVARRQTLNDNRDEALTRDPDKLEQLIEVLQEDLKAAKKAGPNGQPDWHYRVGLQESIVEAYRALLNERQGG